jgi:hypothetical protein
MAKEITLPRSIVSKFNRGIQKDANSIIRMATKKRYENIGDSKTVEVPIADFNKIVDCVQSIATASELFGKQL